MSKKQQIRGFLVFLFAVFIVFTTILSSNIDTTINAETQMDDSASGEKIVDIAMNADGKTYYALSEKGNLFAWGINGQGQLGNGSYSTSANPQKVSSPVPGGSSKFLSGVKRMWATGGETSSGTYKGAMIIALTEDGLYGWGDNGRLSLGIPDARIYALPTPIKLPDGVSAADIKDISVTSNNYQTLLLTTGGDVYVTGTSYNNSGTLGLGSSVHSVASFVKIETMNNGNAMPKITEIATSNTGSFFLTEDGHVLGCGWRYYTGLGTSTDIYSPDYVKVNSTVVLSDISTIRGGMNTGSCLMISSDGTIQIANDNATGYIIPMNVVDNYNVLKYFTYFDPIYNGNNVFIGSDKKLYQLNGFKGGGNSGRQQTVVPYSENAIGEGYSNAKKVVGNDSGRQLLLSNEGAVYLDGVKIAFGDMEISGVKEDASLYADNEKYNDSIDLKVKGIGDITLGMIRYKMSDHMDASQSIKTETNAEASYAITLEDGIRIHRTYDFYIAGREDDTKTPFTIDLYKKSLTLEDVDEDGVYPLHKAITIPASHGFAGNTVSATLTKDGGTPTVYTSGTAISEEGSYVITAIDLYGNQCSYSFSTVDLPLPEGVAFTKTSSGELTYGNTITKVNGIIGSLSLEYGEGKEPSTIKTLTLGTGGNESNFEIVNTNQLKVKGSDLTAQEYTLHVSGTDQNDMAFTGSVTFTIAKGPQTMDFDSATKAFSSGKKMGDVFTLGTSDIVGGAMVTYSADSCATMSSTQATITCVPASGKITFTASAAATTNYSAKSVTLEIPVSSLAVSLKTQVLEGSTYKDSMKIKVGDSLPNTKVTSISPSGFDTTKLGTPTFTHKKAGATVAKPQNTAGTYDVDVSFPSNDGYTLTITKGTLVVEDIVIDEDTKDDYYTLTTGGKVYTPGTWTKDPIIITPKHDNFNKMQVDGGSVTTTAYTYKAEGSKDVTLSFENIDAIKITTTVKLNYDKTAPTMKDFTYEKTKSKLRSFFDHFFGEQKTVVFDAEDSGSGIKSYDYEIYEVDSDGNKVTSSKKTGQGTSYTLAINKAYEINAKATDTAGNVSLLKTERVTLSDNIGKLDINAKSDGKTYDGTKWTSKAIDLTLDGTNISGVVKYQYSEDGVDFHDITGNSVSLPSPLANVNNQSYTFRAINQDGSQNDETFSMKVDMEKPVISVKGKVSGGDYDGSEVGEDVEVIPSQTKASDSGITYYYTKDASAKDSNPLTDRKWIKQSGTILESTNGTHTYYVKGVSGSGLVSDVQSMTLKILKRNYTSVNVNVTSGGKAYSSDTWAKGDVTFKLSGGIADTSMITGYEYAVTTGAKPTTDTTWKAVTGTTLTLNENSKGQTYYFRVLPKDNLGSISKGTIVKLDIEKPSTPTITMKELNTDPIAKFINALSFGNWMKESVEVRITSTDAISGIENYKYSETVNGVKTDKLSKTGVIPYDKNTKLTISSIAIDKAGNVSAVSENKEVMIDKEAPVIVGVKDQGEYKHYYLPRFIHAEDKLSGVKESSIQKNSETATPFTNEISVKEAGVYTVKAIDEAANEITLIFKIVPLPSLDEIDGSDESKEIIDQVQKELDEIKDKIDETEKKDYEDWIEDATDKWDNIRKKVVENEDKTSKVEGVGDTNFDPKVELIVNPIEENSLPVLPRKAMYSYEVYLKKGTTVVQPNGDIKVYLPYPDDANPIIYEIDSNGKVREITATKEGEYVVFTTNTLMKYAISNTKQEIIDDGKVPVPGPDGDFETDDDVIANPSDKDKPTQNPDGSVTLPPGGSVTYPDGIEIETPDGGTLNPDGSLTLPDGTEYDKDGNKKPEVCNLKDTFINLDTDEDGLPDVNVDYDNDCIADLNIDANNDRIPDVDIDSDGDGIADINIDKNNDGVADLNKATIKTWKPDKNCSYKGFKYDTMSNLKPDPVGDEDDNGSQSQNPNGGNQGSTNGDKPSQGGAINTKVSGAYTGDSTSLVGVISVLSFVTLIMIVLCKKKVDK